MADYKNRVERALCELQRGRFVIVCDDETRENEGDLIAAAEHATGELVNFAITEARGLLCQAIDGETASYLELPAMSPANDSPFVTAFTVSVDHREAGTGISAFARALTIRALGAAAVSAHSFRGSEQQCQQRAAVRKSLLRPGHIFPLVAAPGGVLQRRGQTEATIDLMTLAALEPSGILCEIIGADGQMARGRELENFATKHNLVKITVADIAAYRRQVLGQKWSEHSQQRALAAQISLHADTEVELPGTLGNFRLCAIEDKRNIAAEHLLIWQGSLEVKNPLLRIHSECFTGEVLFSQRCDCRAQFDFALKRIEAEGSGLLIYLRQEGRGIGLRHKLRAYQLQQRENLDTVAANAALGFADDLREYSVAIGVLQHLGLQKVRLLTNNPQKIQALEAAGIAVQRLALAVAANPHNSRYLATKKNKNGHLL